MRFGRGLYVAKWNVRIEAVGRMGEARGTHINPGAWQMLSHVSSQTRLLTVVSFFAVGCGLYLNSFAAVYAKLFSPAAGNAFAWFCVVLTVFSPAAAILVGRRLRAIPLVIVLLSTAVSGVSSAVVSPASGMAWGAFVGILVCYPTSELARLLYSLVRLAIVGLAGYLLLMLVRNLALLDAWMGWVSLVVLVGGLMLQTKLLRTPLPRWMRGEEPSPAWQRRIVTVGLLLVSAVVIPTGWWLGWHAALERRVARIEARGGWVHYRRNELLRAIERSLEQQDWRFRALGGIPFDSDLFWGALTELALGPKSPQVRLNDASRDDVRTLRALRGIWELEIRDTDVDDSAIAGLELNRLRSLSFWNTKVTGSFLADLRVAPQLQAISAYSSPFSDQALENLTARDSVTYIALNNTRVTAAGISQLRSMDVWPFLQTGLPPADLFLFAQGMLQDERPEARAWAILQLARVGAPLHPEVVPLLVGALDDPDEMVVDQAISALCGIPTPAATTELLSVLRNRLENPAGRRNAVWDLLRLGERAEPAIPWLLEMFEQEIGDSDQILQVILRIGTPLHLNRAEEILTKRLEGPFAETEKLRLANLRICREVGDPFYMPHQVTSQKVDVSRFAKYQRLLSAQLRHLPTDHPDLLTTHLTLARQALELDRFAFAEEQAEEFLELYFRVPPAARRIEQAAQAEAVFRGCLEIRQEKQVLDWEYYYLRQMLGAAMVAQHRHIFAEPLIQESVEQLYAAQEEIPAERCDAVLSSAARTLSRLYSSWGKADLAARWKRIAEEGL